jgi:hypothetical protein
MNLDMKLIRTEMHDFEFMTCPTIAASLPLNTTHPWVPAEPARL